MGDWWLPAIRLRRQTLLGVYWGVQTGLEYEICSSCCSTCLLWRVHVCQPQYTASVNQNVTDNVLFEKSEEWPPCDAHKLKHTELPTLRIWRDYHAQVDCIMLLHPWWNHYAKYVNKILKWSFSCQFMHVSEGRERVHQQLTFSCGCATANWLLHFGEAGQ